MKKSIFKSSTVIILVIALLAVNVVAFLWNDYDLDGKYALKVSSESARYLKSLENEVEIYVIEGGAQDTKFERFIEDYAEQSDKISLEFVDVSKAGELLSLCGYTASDDVSSYAVVVKSDKRAKLLDYYSMFYYQNANFGKLSYSQYLQYYSMFSSNESYLSYLDSLIYDTDRYFYGDALITGLVEYVSFDVIPRAYMVTTHGVNSAKDGNFAKLLIAMGYEYGELALGEDTKIPEDAGMVMINEPTSDISSDEAEDILSYLKNGGRLLLITDEAAVDMPNLLRVADYYGVSVGKGRVAELVEEKESFKLTPTLNVDHDIIASMGSYEPRIVNANALEIKKDGLRPSQLVTPLLTTSKEAYIEGAADQKQSFALAVSVEEETAKGNTRLVWFTGADSFNGAIDSADSLALLVYSTAWLNKTYESEVGAIDAVIYGERTPRMPEKAVTVGAVLTVVTSIAIVVFGAIVVSKRKKA